MAPFHDSILLIASCIMYDTWSGLIHVLEGGKKRNMEKGRKKRRNGGREAGRGREKGEGREGKEKEKGRGIERRKGNKKKRAAHNVVSNSFCLFY